MDGEVPPPLPAPAAVIFNEGICLVFSRWSALEMALMNEWGGRDSRLKAQQLAGDVFTYFTCSRNEPLYIDDLEKLLKETMKESMNTVVDDGSIEEVAEKLMIMHEECLGGNYQSVQKLREAPRANNVPHVRQDDDDSDDDDSGSDDGSEGENMFIDQPGPRPTPMVGPLFLQGEIGATETKFNTQCPFFMSIKKVNVIMSFILLMLAVLLFNIFVDACSTTCWYFKFISNRVKFCKDANEHIKKQMPKKLYKFDRVWNGNGIAVN